MKRVVCSVTFLAIATSPVLGQAGDPQAGLALAQRVCSECHAIRSGQMPLPSSPAPTFLEFATTPGMTAAALTAALATPHAGMPMLELTADQRRDLIAYILSLR